MDNFKINLKHKRFLCSQNGKAGLKASFFFAIINLMWSFYSSNVPVIRAECMCYKNVVISKYHFSS